jgi:predicted transcriptional regulator
MKKYFELKQEIQARVDAFPFMFAFSMQQFEEGKQRLGVKDNSELLSIGSGGYIRKTDSQAYTDLIEETGKTREEYLKDPAQFKDALIYELANHEYCYTYDSANTLEALGLEEDELTGEQLAIIKEAIAEYMRGVEL